jgi:hypothetical protein
MPCESDKDLDLFAEVGATFRWRLIVSDESGTPIDWSASTAKMQVRAERGGAIVVELDSDPDGGIVLGTEGEIDLRVEADATWTADGRTLERQARYVYDLLVTTDGDTDRIVEGTIQVRPGVTTPPP